MYNPNSNDPQNPYMTKKERIAFYVIFIVMCVVVLVLSGSRAHALEITPRKQFNVVQIDEVCINEYAFLVTMKDATATTIQIYENNGDGYQRPPQPKQCMTTPDCITWGFTGAELEQCENQLNNLNHGAIE